MLKKEILGVEFFYSSNDWIELEGSKFKDIKKEINKFEKEHSLKIRNSYPKEKIVSFINSWAEEKRKKSTSDLTKELF